MPDITMCPGTNCPMKKDCYRYKAIPSENQDHFFSAPNDGGKCTFFWKLKPEYKTRYEDEIKEDPVDGKS